jgi:hypothetical protein
MDRVHGVLWEAVCPRVGLGGKQIAGVAQMGESTVLSSHPDIILASTGDRVDDIVGKSIDGDDSAFSFLQPSQPPLNGGNPSAAAVVNVQWSHTLRFQIGKRVGNKSAVSESLQAAQATNPDISLPIFEERSYRSSSSQ